MPIPKPRAAGRQISALPRRLDASQLRLCPRATRYGVSATAASGVATRKLKLSSR